MYDSEMFLSAVFSGLQSGSLEDTQGYTHTFGMGILVFRCRYLSLGDLSLGKHHLLRPRRDVLFLHSGSGHQRHVCLLFELRFGNFRFLSLLEHTFQYRYTRKTLQ